MGIGISLLLIALGGVLIWAVSFESSALDLDVVGIILIVVGSIGLLMALLFWSSFAPYGRREAEDAADRHPRG